MQWNWAGGGNNNGNGILACNLKLAYKKDNISWETTFDSDYGWMWTPSTAFKWRKSNDKIVFSTKFGWEFHKSWYLTVMAGFKSHYHDGYDYKIGDDGASAASWVATSSRLIWTNVSSPSTVKCIRKAIPSPSMAPRVMCMVRLSR